MAVHKELVGSVVSGMHYARHSVPRYSVMIVPPLDVGTVQVSTACWVTNDWMASPAGGFGGSAAFCITTSLRSEQKEPELQPSIE